MVDVLPSLDVTDACHWWKYKLDKLRILSCKNYCLINNILCSGCKFIEMKSSSSLMSYVLPSSMLFYIDMKWHCTFSLCRCTYLWLFCSVKSPSQVPYPLSIAIVLLGCALVFSLIAFAKGGPSSLLAAIAKSGLTAAFTLIFVSEIGDKVTNLP